MSLTPESRREEAVAESTKNGFINGFMTLVPSCGALYVALQNPAFVKRTNWQSRTAMVIMPALFVFGYTSEHKLTHKMREIAQETRHSSETVDWAEQELKKAQLRRHMTAEDSKLHVTDLYRQSLATSAGVCIVPGNELGLHHKAANYAAENPFKVLMALAVPTVATIFYGRSGKEHLQPSMKLLHTRVFGQAATISLLLSVMGFKEYMDRYGKFITQADADARVEEMHRVREALLRRLDRD